MKRLLVTTALLLAIAPVQAEPLPRVEIYMPTPCLACIEWGVHLMDNGFAVDYRETADMAAVKRRLQVPRDMESVHTATMAGYFIEGHVPADDIKELLRDKPKALGLAVPGLPRGAPGRESRAQTCETGCTILDGGNQETRRDLYETLLVAPDGKTRIWARH